MGEVHMDKGRVVEDRGSKETDGCPHTALIALESYACKCVDPKQLWGE
jgi:hypothetical protein